MERHEVVIDLFVHYDYAVALLNGHVDVSRLCLGICCVSDVLMLAFGELGKSLILTVSCLIEADVFNLLKELLFFHHAVLNEYGDIGPVLLIVFPLLLEQLIKLIGDLLDDMAGELLYVFILLQSRTRYIQRQIRAVKASLEQEEEIRDYLFDIVCNEDLMVIDLDPSVKVLIDIISLGEI